MRLTQRLLLGALFVVGLLLVALAVGVARPLRNDLLAERLHDVARQAAYVGAQWRGDTDPDSLADAAAAALGRRVVLVTPDGRVVGDSRLTPAQLARAADAESVALLADALRDSIAWRRERNAAAGVDALQVAVRTGHGVVWLDHDLRPMAELFAAARRQTLLAGLGALAVAGLLALLFATHLRRPLEELRDVTQALAAGDLARRPALTGPGELGDLASAVHRLAEQLAGRLAALEAEEALLGALTDALTEGVVAVSRTREVVRCNATARTLLDVRAPVPFPAEHLPRERQLREALDAALAGAPSDIPELALGERVLALSARPLPNGGAVLALFDLTPLKRLETVRRDFVANVSHELRTPLTVIGGFAETLDDDSLPAEQRRRFAATIRTNAARMQRIVDDLLDLSRIESGGWVPKPQSLSVRTVAEETLQAAGAAAARQDARLELEIAPGAERVHADPTAIRQVLANLVDNAIRHTPGGRVRVHAQRAAGGVAVAVEDTGCGIPPEHLPRIFERFYRVDAARSRAEGGTGLGLAIVRHFVEAHGGRIRAESTPGRGTTITVLFPDPAPSAPGVATSRRRDASG